MHGHVSPMYARHKIISSFIQLSSETVISSGRGWVNYLHAHTRWRFRHAHHETRDRLSSLGFWGCVISKQTGARCSSVVRAFAHGAMGRRIDPSWWIHWAISRSSQCSKTGVTKVMACTILNVLSERVAHVLAAVSLNKTFPSFSTDDLQRVRDNV